MRFRPVFIGDSARFRIFEKRPDAHQNAPRRRFDVTNCPEEWVPRGCRADRCCRSSTLAGSEVGFEGDFEHPLMTIQEVAGNLELFRLCEGGLPDAVVSKLVDPGVGIGEKNRRMGGNHQLALIVHELVDQC